MNNYNNFENMDMQYVNAGKKSNCMGAARHICTLYTTLMHFRCSSVPDKHSEPCMQNLHYTQEKRILGEI
jgi:hypothetical protein